MFQNKMKNIKINMYLFFICIILVLNCVCKAEKNYKEIINNSTYIEDGKYYIYNIGSSKYLNFLKIKDANLSDKKEIIIIKNHKNNNYKNLYSIHYYNNNLDYCLSAGWGTSSDNYAPFYCCRVAVFNKQKCKTSKYISSPSSIMENDKQLWIFRRIGHEQYFIIPVAHINDQKIRYLYGKHHNKYSKEGSYKGLYINEIKNNDNLFLWKLEKK